MCVFESMGDEQARRVGVLAGTSAHDDVIDLVVVEGAIRRGDAIVTSDGAGIRSIADAAGASIRIAEV